MRATAFREILEGIDALPADDQAKQAFRRLVLAIGSAHGAPKLDHPERVAFARHLLTIKTSRPTIRDRLIARYSVSRRHAYRIIQEALQLCPKAAVSVTGVASNTNTIERNTP